MIKVRCAKSAIENEEGMNHLWVQLTPIAQATGTARVQLTLPTGLHRLPNLNGFEEDDTGEVLIHNPRIASELFIEIFTRELVSCGEKTITVALCYKYGNGCVTRVEHFVPMKVVMEEEIENAAVDEEVVRKIKELQQLQNVDDNLQDITDYTPAKLIRMDPNQLSEWERKYRIEGLIQ
ncbi:hypothetical protein [Paenibacillus alkalitolerans]|uniref:hypothetical protein n=1 Tax=Paenibacillus alkalitolerans TaxID=2799335 RepID=UPI0018F57F79|nr:hypothetical protein [Paenibacillus alkalitolerans]